MDGIERLSAYVACRLLPEIALAEDRNCYRNPPRSNAPKGQRFLWSVLRFSVIDFVQINSFEQLNLLDRDLALLGVKRYAARVAEGRNQKYDCKIRTILFE